MNICVVANKRILKRNYSAFIDQCDLIARINRMENLPSGLAGTRTDIALVSLHAAYWRFSPENRQTDALRKAGQALFFPDLPGAAKALAQQQQLNNWSYLPAEFHKRTQGATTCATITFWMHEKFPEAQIFFLGDLDAWTRTPSQGGFHACSAENHFLGKLVQEKKLIPILEENTQTENGRYSVALTEAEQSRQQEEILTIGSDTEKEYILEANHPRWKDLMIVKGTRANRLTGYNYADVLSFNHKTLALKWDRWGTEHFVRTEGLSYRLETTVK